MCISNHRAVEAGLRRSCFMTTSCQATSPPESQSPIIARDVLIMHSRQCHHQDAFTILLWWIVKCRKQFEETNHKYIAALCSIFYPNVTLPRTKMRFISLLLRRLCPKCRLDIFLGPINGHTLFFLFVQFLTHPVDSIQDLLVPPLTLFAYHGHQRTGQLLLICITKVLLNTFAKRLDASSNLLGVVGLHDLLGCAATV